MAPAPDGAAPDDGAADERSGVDGGDGVEPSDADGDRAAAEHVVDAPRESVLPQQFTAPSTSSAQVEALPAVTERAPTGAAAAGGTSTASSTAHAAMTQDLSIRRESLALVDF